MKDSMQDTTSSLPLVIVQARLESTRFPDKVIQPIYEQPMILWQLARIEHGLFYPHNLVVSCPHTLKTNLTLRPLLENHGYTVSVPRYVDCQQLTVRDVEEWDVLARFTQTSLEHFSDILDENYIDADKIIVRITGDCPLIDPTLIATALDYLEEDETIDYVALDRTWPDGLDVEAMRLQVLFEAYKEATLTSEKEHVTPYIWGNRDKFKQKLIPCPFNLSLHNWSVDTFEDYTNVSALLEVVLEQYGFDFTWRDVWLALREHEAFYEWSAGRERNVGYLQSIREERERAYNSEPIPPCDTWEKLRYD